MPFAILLLVAIAAFLPIHAHGATGSIDTAQQALTVDMYACARPAYPAAALALGVGGQVVLEVQVGADGGVRAARVASSSGRADLDEAALLGVRRCAFHAVLALGPAPAGWLKTQFAWRPGAPRFVPDEAFLAATKARADAGQAEAQNRLGAWHEHGAGVERDLVQAAAWYRLAADAGDAVAQNNLGVLYPRGAGVARDRAQAVHWYALAAEQGHGWAQANLAWAYQHGSVGKPDLARALDWLTRSAEGGLAPAQVRLGLLAMRRAASDEERFVAAAWLARAAGQDAPAGHYYLGRSVELGLGGDADDARAAALYRKALGRSGGRAETALGVLLDSGRVEANTPDEAFVLYGAAMAARHAAAFYRYGALLEGRGADPMAAALFEHGAQLGSCEAGIRLLQIRRAQGKGGFWQHRAPPTLAWCSAPFEAEPAF